MPAIVAQDALGDVVRVGDERRRPSGGAVVPSDQRRDRRPGQRGGSESADVALIREGKAAHGVDVTDVRRAGPNAHALRPGRRRAHHEIVRGQIEGLEGERIERCQKAEIAPREGQHLQGGGVNAPRVDDGTRDLRLEQRRVDRRLRKRVGDVPENAFGPAQLVEIVVHEGGSRAGKRCGGRAGLSSLFNQRHVAHRLPTLPL